jgi:uncharacterized protein (TIGR02118 family)
MKTVGLMPKRPDISRAAFRDHYENRHAPLALGKFPFEKYVRNHVVASDPDPIGFDCLSEFWVENVAEIYTIMAGPIGDIMREDELRFTNQDRIGPAVAEEIHVAGSPRIVDDGITHKEILLIRPAPGVSNDEFIDGAVRWGKALADGSDGRLPRVMMDTLVPFEGRPFPDFQAILYGWSAGQGGVLYDAAPPDKVEIYGRLKIEGVETRFD